MTQTTTTQPMDPRDRQQELNLLSAVLEGDTRASNHFVTRYRKVIESRVRCIFARYRSDMTEEDVQDMVGEIWVAIFEDDMLFLRRFDPSRSIKVATWVGLLARNRTIDRLRASRERPVSLTDLGESFEPASAGAMPTELLEQQERECLAQRAIDRLSPDERRFIQAWYVEAADPETLARRFSVAIGTVYSRRFKIQTKLACSIKHMTRPCWDAFGQTPASSWSSAA